MNQEVLGMKLTVGAVTRIFSLKVKLYKSETVRRVDDHLNNAYDLVDNEEVKYLAKKYKLNKEQANAVELTDGATLVIAGPGSGKTRVLTAKIANLVRKEYLAKGALLAVTFTNKASEEMRQRVTVLLAEENNIKEDVSRKVWISTFHSFCLKILRSNPSKVNLPSNFQVLDTDDCRKLIKDALKQLKYSYEPSDCRSALSSISLHKNTGAPLSYQTQKVLEVYQGLLKDLAALDFDDILLYTKSALADEALCRKYQEYFIHILVDEFQDTNMLQYEIIKRISNGNITCVGDVDQSIYSWRGSSPEVVSRFEQDFKKTKTVVLSENYRSTPEILALCGNIIKSNPSLHRPELKTNNPKGESVRLLYFDNDKEEIRFIAEEINKTSNETALIVRVNSQTRVIEETLTKNYIPYQIIGGIRFYERSEVKDLLAYLKAAINERDTLSFSRVINLPKRKIGDVTLNYILSSAKEQGLSPVEFCRRSADDTNIPKNARKSLAEFINHLDEIKDKARDKPSTALKYIFNETKLKEMYQSEGAVGKNKIENALELIYVSEDSNDRNAVESDGVSISEINDFTKTILFLERTSLGSGEDTKSARVQIMTAHASKGREFTDVYVIGLEESVFPHYLKDEEPDEQEERRLLFVAASRAMERLTLTLTEHRALFGSVRENKKSRFLKDMELEITEISPVTISKTRELSDRVFSSYSEVNVANPSRKKHPDTPKGPRVSLSQAKVGAKVKHEYFGVGEILSVDGLYVTIKFTESVREIKVPLAPMSVIE
ncbi:MAG: ATP-dependent helicase [Candidatus Paceibacterota bacterium]